MAFTPIGGGGDHVGGVLHSQGEVLPNKGIDTYNSNESYMHHDGAGGYSTCSGPFSHLDLSIVKENGEESRDLLRGLSSSNRALVGGHPLDLEVRRGKEPNGKKRKRKEENRSFKLVRWKKANMANRTMSRTVSLQ